MPLQIVGRSTIVASAICVRGHKQALHRSEFREGCNARVRERAAGLTQAELAERSTVAQSTIAQIEGGARPTPHPRTLKKLAKALGVETHELLDDLDD
jgi:ribosome-binding protein aMBF1 (putative translation factor)